MASRRNLVGLVQHFRNLKSTSLQRPGLQAIISRLWPQPLIQTMECRSFCSSSNLCLSSSAQEKLSEETSADVSPKETEEESARLALSELSETDARRLKILQLELDVFYSTGHRVTTMTNTRWLQVLNQCTSVSSRLKIYKYWFKVDMAKRKAERKKEENIHIMADRLRELERKKEEGLDLTENRIMFRIRSATMNRHFYNNLVFAMQYGLHLVFDYDFEDSMRGRELQNTIDQLLFCHAANKVHPDPFHFVFTNVNADFRKRFARSHGLEDIPYTLSDKDYTELYPKHSLVYLTPDAPKMLTNFDPNDVYVIGAMVDASGQGPLTFAKAKRQNIRTARLPLEKYVDWQLGSKTLSLDVVTKILLEVKTSNSWNEALKHLPSRKIRGHYK